MASNYPIVELRDAFRNVYFRADLQLEQHWGADGSTLVSTDFTLPPASLPHLFPERGPNGSPRPASGLPRALSPVRQGDRHRQD